MPDPITREPMSDVAEVIAMLADPATSYWLRDAIVSACRRDPFDAERDALAAFLVVAVAEVLHKLLVMEKVA